MEEQKKPSNPNCDLGDLNNLSGLLNVLKKNIMQTLGVSIPAIIIEYDYVKNTVQVQPAIKIVTTNDETINRPILSNIPVVSFGGGGFTCRTPLRKGDTGFLVVCDRDISLFKQMLDVVEPNTYRKHDFCDSYFIPSTMDSIDINVDDKDDFVIQNSDGTKKIKIGESGIKIKGNVVVEGDLTATGTITGTTDVKAGSISGKTHIHGGVQTGGGTTSVPQ